MTLTVMQQALEALENSSDEVWNEYNDYWISGLNKAKAAIAKATGETE
jgi:hypothetical protein